MFFSISSFFQTQPAQVLLLESYSLDFFKKNTFVSNATASDLERYRLLIKNFLEANQGNNEVLDAFIQSYVEWGIKQNSTQAFTCLIDLLSLNSLNAIIQWKTAQGPVKFDDLYEWAKQQAALCPQSIPDSSPLQIKSLWKKNRNLVVFFIPNVINIFASAFNFLDSSKRFTSLWEKHLVIDIICRFFLLPYLLATALTPLMATAAKAYLVTGAILFSTLSTMTIYQRFKPCPEDIVNCKNLDRQMELGFIRPIISRQYQEGDKVINECKKVVAKLLGGANVLIIADSGEGKTALMNEIVQRKKNKQLPVELQKLKNQELDCGLLISNVSFGHSELINQTKEQIAGFEENILLFVDEIDHLIKQPSAFDAFKKRFLEDKPRPLIVATTTHEGLAKMQKLDEDQSFISRFSRIVLKPSTDKQLHSILKNYSQWEASDLIVEEKAIEEIIKVSSDYSFLKRVARPRKAIKILQEAIGVCRANFALADELSSPYRQIKQITQAFAIFKKDLMTSHNQLARLSQMSLKAKPFIEKKYLVSTFYTEMAYSKILKEACDLAVSNNNLHFRVTTDVIQSIHQEHKETEALLAQHLTAEKLT
jgi:ATP-dependent Clp protease ATP-binding subunit ClpB